LTLELTELRPLWWLLALAVAGTALVFTLVDRPRRRRLVAHALRLAAIALVVLSLCRPTTTLWSDALHVHFLVDISASVDAAVALDAADEIAKAIGELGPGDSWSIAAFGAEGRLLESVDELRELLRSLRDAEGDDASRAGSELVSALRAGRLTLPSGVARRVVVYSDARPTGATDIATDETVRRLAEEGVDLRLRTLPSRADREVAVSGARPATPAAFEGETVRLSADVIANSDARVEARLVHRGAVAQRQTVSLRGGEPATVEFSAPMITPGRSVWSIEIVPEEDHFLINNSASCVVEVSGRPRVLVVHEDPREMRYLERALERQDILVETRPPTGLPGSIQRLLAFDAVVLADVPATAIPYEQMDLLRRYVADYAGGLAMLGSENSFGLGGYHRTPVEEALPLVSRYEKEEEEPSVAIALVIDKSGSMQGLPIAMARQAAKSTVELLSEQDQAAVVAFDSQAFVFSPMRTAVSGGEIAASIDRIGAGGGTNLFAGLLAAERLLESASAQTRHAIVLSDGVTQPADHASLIRRLADQGVTVSTVALGPGADRDLLAQLAHLGNGRYYETLDPATVPQIFARETMQASKSAIKETFSSSVAIDSHPMFDGMNVERLPFILGYVMTRPKPSARVLLATESGDPLLAVNHYGLGSTLAYASDLTDRWGAEWINSSSFGRFWAQAIRSILRIPDAGEVSIQDKLAQDRWSVRIQQSPERAASEPPGRWSAEITSGSGESRPVNISETGVGRWAVSADVAEHSSHTMRLVNEADGTLRTLHLERGYSEEYNLAADPHPTLTRLPSFLPSKVREGAMPAQVTVELMPWCLVAALSCAIAGVAIRRV